MKLTLREKYPYSELFWCVFSLIRTEYGEYIRIQGPNEGKYGPEKLQIRTHFTQFEIIEIFLFYDQPWAGESMGFDFMFDPKLTRSPLRRLFGKWGLNFWKPFDPSVET